MNKNKIKSFKILQEFPQKYPPMTSFSPLTYGSKRDIMMGLHYIVQIQLSNFVSGKLLTSLQ
jgi:hypothetical protein